MTGLKDKGAASYAREGPSKSATRRALEAEAGPCLEDLGILPKG